MFLLKSGLTFVGFEEQQDPSWLSETAQSDLHLLVSIWPRKGLEAWMDKYRYVCSSFRELTRRTSVIMFIGNTLSQ